MRRKPVIVRNLLDAVLFAEANGYPIEIHPAFAASTQKWIANTEFELLDGVDTALKISPIVEVGLLSKNHSAFDEGEDKLVGEEIKP